jgi:hypothetical protein
MRVRIAGVHGGKIRKLYGCHGGHRRSVFWTVLLSAVFLSTLCHADSNATVSGLVTDSSGGAVGGVVVAFTNVNNGIAKITETNREGIYRLPGLLPGVYRANLTKDGFSSIVKGDIDLHVQDEVSINFVLRAGSVFESVTVEGGTPLVSNESPAVSTVVDRQFADSLPLNGRSFQTLIDLTPGVVLIVSSPSDAGQFSINGQRGDANYWTVDGVSANTGISSTNIIGNGAGGGLPVFTAQGGTNSMVSLDAMREFRIEASSSSAEFGRVPGAQISIVTRSGTNLFHGSLFDYFRNDVLDANDWFAHAFGLPKPEERQNDFGGTLGGPIVKGRTFFFLSYEGLRLRLPLTAFSAVPDNATVVGGLSSRENAVPQMRPYLNASPLPNGPEIFEPCVSSDPTCPSTGQKASGAAYFNASFSDGSSLDAYSLRIDHSVSKALSVFGRYSYSPSDLQQRLPFAPSTVNPLRFSTQSTTVGATWSRSLALSNDLRFNYARTAAQSSYSMDRFGGAIPFPAPPSTDPLAHPGSLLALQTLVPSIILAQGIDQQNLQRQFNLVDNVSIQMGRHSLGLGMDIRRLTPFLYPDPYLQNMFFADVQSLSAGESFFARVESHLHGTLLFRNLGFFAHDKWRALPRLTLNYGVRWDIDAAPKSLDGPGLVAVTGFNLEDLSQLNLAPAGTPPFRTTYGNFAPRVGATYQVGQRSQFQTVIRGGVGIFYDLATQEVGNSVGIADYPFGATKFLFGSVFPLDSNSASPPAVTASELSNGRLSAFDPNLRLPYTLEWNGAVEQALGQEQTVSATYVGAAGRRLIQTGIFFFANSGFREASLVTNAASSSYHALELQFNRRLNHGVQALASYTWSHSIDDASAGSAFGNAANALVPGVMAEENRGASDFDVRHSLSAGITYTLSFAERSAWAKWVLRGWSAQSILQVRSAPPVNVYIPDLSDVTDHTQIRPDVTPGIPLYVYGRAFPGGRGLNGAPGAVSGGCPDGSVSVGPYCPPPTDANGRPLRQGSLGRNELRAFGAGQWDLGVHRDFPIREWMSLQFRAEMFNILNHPNFGPPNAQLTFSKTPLDFPSFGRASQMLGQGLSGGNLAGGGLDPLYQFGGPRSIQLALRLVF